MASGLLWAQHFKCNGISAAIEGTVSMTDPLCIKAGYTNQDSGLFSADLGCSAPVAHLDCDRGGRVGARVDGAGGLIWLTCDSCVDVTKAGQADAEGAAVLLGALFWRRRRATGEE